MSKIKYAVATAGTVAVLMLGAAPVAATSVDIDSHDDNSVQVDKSQTVNGDCSAIQNQDVDQNQNSSTNQDNEGVNVGENVSVLPILSENDQDVDQNNNQSNSSNTNQNQSNSQSFEADCSTTNVTNVQSQVDAPEGGVDAGAGGLGTLFGLSGSLATAGYGVLRFRRR